jgi:signal peptidase I
MSDLPPHPIPPAPPTLDYPAGPAGTTTPAPPATTWTGNGRVNGSPKHRAKASGGRLRGIVEWVVIIAIALTGAVLMRTFLVQAFYIPSASMNPTLQQNDRVLVNKTSYRLHSVHRGDIVVFAHSPGFDPTIKDLIKRVIGLPGETVSGRGGQVYINGHPLNEPYLPQGSFTTDFGPKYVAPHTYWVMGDNRGNSTDSRVFGAITAHQIVGRAFVLWWPLSRIHLL